MIIEVNGKYFAIVKNGKKWEVWTDGVKVREAQTKKELIQRINNQTL